jgi:DNA-binding response OmpR family regulator
MGTAAFRDHPFARRLAGKRILIAEDDTDIRKMLRIVLEAVGAVVSEAGSLKQTIGQLQGAAVDALVLDWNLGGTTGDRLFAEIATLSPPFGGSILVISGDQRVSTAALLETPRASVLLKPFLPVDLVAALGGLLTPPT